MKNFDIKDFDCPCCGFNVMDPAHLKMLDDARDMAGVPFIVSSGCRCKKHNKDEGGSPTSSHLTGYASDILVKYGGSFYRYKVVRGLLIAGFRRIGVYKEFIHADNDPNKIERVLWI